MGAALTAGKKGRATARRHVISSPQARYLYL